MRISIPRAPQSMNLFLSSPPEDRNRSHFKKNSQFYLKNKNCGEEQSPAK
jgi:hypothetical protein